MQVTFGIPCISSYLLYKPHSSLRHGSVHWLSIPRRVNVPFAASRRSEQAMVSTADISIMSEKCCGVPVLFSQLSLVCKTSENLSVHNALPIRRRSSQQSTENDCRS